jgi:hypothetical protein
MSKRRPGLLLPVGRLWLMSLPFRLGSGRPTAGFQPGMKNTLAYELRRIWHRLYERERLGYYIGVVRSMIGQKNRRS